ncbi:low affinity immunoglobulin epsilon Fc receptor-like protein [Leptotrombidium deliense]|uniref:Low affinity immunoglobulin epsilon Fc receptor-like protein n=1 Tax=Leptotrombidium deliense TaxID=299467 RepID=A0A443S7N3_9ACAR|nr:low affinity immunoglobulin epsilon Fc receptor-like protein [Leptotrombidium deliense]
MAVSTTWHEKAIYLLLLMNSFVYSDDTSCPGIQWIQFGNKCYYFDEMLVTPDEQIEMCRLIDAKTVSVTSSEENEFLNDHLYWKHNYWLNMKKNRLSEYEWADGSNITFNKWALNEPNNENLGCSNVILHNGKWFDVACLPLAFPLCETSAKQSDTIVITKTFNLFDVFEAQYGSSFEKEFETLLRLWDELKDFSIEKSIETYLNRKSEIKIETVVKKVEQFENKWKRFDDDMGGYGSVIIDTSIPYLKNFVNETMKALKM